MADPEDNEGRNPRGLPDELQSALHEYLADTGGVDRPRFEAVAGYIQETLAEQDGGHNEIDTRSGETIRPLDPDPSKIRLEDIAHGLANVGRFAGQGSEFYSVARHSVHVSREVEARGGSAEAQRYALVHDAAEAYLSDVPGPVKKSLPGYKHAEKRLDAGIEEALDLGVDDSEHKLVKDADTGVGMYELSVFFSNAEDEERVDLDHDPDAVGTDEDDKALLKSRAADVGFDFGEASEN
jgi:5'-deoxynucleotidase YfbR-like HD superfamily hydrolase